MRFSCLVVLSGCFAPAPPVGLPCSQSGDCPTPQVCGPMNTCELTIPAGVGEATVRWTLSGSQASKLVFDPAKVVIQDALRLRSIDQLDHDGALDGFGGGVGVGAQWNAARGLLEGQKGQATFVSRVFDAGGVVDWSSISWRPERPSGKPIPDDRSETAYPAGNLNRSGLRLLLHMENTVRDSSGMAHDGLNNGGSYATSGHFGTALALNGADFVDHGSPPGLDITGSFSVSLWVRRTSALAGFIISKEQNPPGNGWCLFFNSAGAIVFCIASAGTQSITTSTTFSSTTAWYHVAATHQNAAQRIYVDGVLQQSGSLAIDPMSSPSPLNLGKRFNNVSYLHAELDEVAVFARALTAAEVHELYLRGATRLGLQVRSCPDATCAGIPFVGPGGSATSSFRETVRAALPAVSLTPAEAPPNRYFQYRLALDSDDPVDVARVAQVQIDPAHVFAGSAVVTHADPFPFSRLIGFADTVGVDHTGSVRYQFSRDGTTWYYHSNGAWTIAADLSQASTASEMGAGCASFAAEVGAGMFQWRAILTATAGVHNVELAEITVRYMP